MSDLLQRIKQYELAVKDLRISAETQSKMGLLEERGYLNALERCLKELYRAVPEVERNVE